MKMNHRRNLEGDGLAEARALLAEAARSVSRLESAAEQALYRLAALAGMRSRLADLAGLYGPDAAAAALYAAAVCRDARALQRSLDALGKRLAVITVVVQLAATPSAGYTFGPGPIGGRRAPLI